MMVTGVPQEVGDRLMLLYKEHDHRLVPEVVVADATSPHSPLHSYFDWDQSEAAQKWRVHQARLLINRVRVEVITDDQPPVRVRGFIATEAVTGEYGQGYVSVDDIEHKSKDAAAVLASIERDINRLRRKYKGFESLFETVLQDQAGSN